MLLIVVASFLVPVSAIGGVQYNLFGVNIPAKCITLYLYRSNKPFDRKQLPSPEIKEDERSLIGGDSPYVAEDCVNSAGTIVETTVVGCSTLFYTWK